MLLSANDVVRLGEYLFIYGMSESDEETRYTKGRSPPYVHTQEDEPYVHTQEDEDGAYRIRGSA